MSFGGNIILGKKSALLNGVWCLSQIIKSFGGKIVLRKRSLRFFERCLVLSQKYTKSFGGKIVLRKRSLRF